MMRPAIANKRKSFLKKFSKLENWEWFHQVVHRLFEAPTIPITRLIQQKIVSDLEARGEARTAKWYLETWTGDYVNYTNATAGYVGNNKSAGIESHWKYMRRDTIGSAGSNIRLSLAVYVPNLLKHIRPPRSLRQVILCVTVILVFIFFFCRFYVKCISRSQEEPSPSTYAHDDAASPPRGRRGRKQASSQP